MGAPNPTERALLEVSEILEDSFLFPWFLLGSTAVSVKRKGKLKEGGLCLGTFEASVSAKDSHVLNHLRQKVKNLKQEGDVITFDHFVDTIGLDHETITTQKIPVMIKVFKKDAYPFINQSDPGLDVAWNLGKLYNIPNPFRDFEARWWSL